MRNKKENSKDPVQVYCRLRPLKNLTDLAAVRRYSDQIIQLYHPSGLKPEAFYNFKFVFPEDATQKDVFEEIAYPLAEDLLNGKDGLLFTYGITSSGKTYTLTGNCLNPGILPRTLDVIFNTIQQRQARKYIFKPDGSNYFEIRSNADALIELQREKMEKQSQLFNQGSRTPTRRQKNNINDEYKEWESRQKDDSTCELSEDNRNLFSVFVSYVEIYNNYIYDLLDDRVIDQIKQKQPISKNLREDIRKKVFVLNGVEIEVKSADEATELFIKGIKRRRIAHTALNAESSRSHSVFNIKIVQAPKDADGEVVRDSKFMVVSQLSLVDLAGSERVGRTKNTGDRLREASSINNSLMKLRSCIDVLRENQRTNQNKLVPYRDNKLTHLFKSYFEGCGLIKMTICVNPSADDFDETIHVMKFAEATQEVMINRASNIQFAKFDLVNFNSLNVVYPTTDFNDINDDKIFPDWFAALDERKKNRDLKLALFKEKSLIFRNSLAKIDKSSHLDKQRLTTLENDLAIREQQIKDLEKHCGQQQSSIDGHLKKIQELEFNVRDLENEMSGVKRELCKEKMKTDTLNQQYRDKHNKEIQALKNAFKRKLKDAVNKLEHEEHVQKEKKEIIKNILEAESLDIFRNIRDSIYPNEINLDVQNNRNSINTPNQQLRLSPVKLPSNDKQTPQKHQSRFQLTRDLFETNVKRLATDNYQPAPRESRKRPAGTPVANPRHKRSLSSGNEKWIDHKPLGTIDLGTVMTPKIKNGKSVTNLRKLSTNNLINSSKYALTHHIANEDGDVETHIYKGDVIPTTFGGAQIMFNDIEMLQQTSPKKSKPESYNIGIDNN